MRSSFPADNSLQGKQLFSIFKEAQGNYKEKKSQIKAEKLQRSQTFDHSRAIPEPPRYYQDDEQYYYDQHARRRSFDGGSERGSERSHRSSQSRRLESRDPRDWDTRSRLTAGNLKTLSEVSSVTPSRAPPRSYVMPYAETMAVSKRDLNHTEMRSMAMSTREPGGMVPRTRSANELSVVKPRKEIDMDLAYGNIPPDLEYRTDLDPRGEEKEATDLVHRVENLLDEAKCVHHSATATITHLQKDPDAAAAVALSLAELSSLVKKTSPAFLAVMKSASPAVFSLLASPQFLIGSTIAVGVTVVCFGGWKIVQRVNEQRAAREALAYENVPMDRPAPLRTQSEYGAGVDEALIIDDDLSSIETWRRGIVPGETESADFELITPTAIGMYGKDDDDMKSLRSTRTSRTSKTNKTSKTSKTHESSRSHRSHRSSRDDRDRDSDRGSRRGDNESIADSERSSRSHRSSKRREKSDVKSIEDGRSRRGDDEISVVMRPKSHRQSSNMLKALFKSKKERDMVLA